MKNSEELVVAVEHYGKNGVRFNRVRPLVTCGQCEFYKPVKVAYFNEEIGSCTNNKIPWPSEDDYCKYGRKK